MLARKNPDTGLYYLVGDKDAEIDQANRFLRTLEIKGLSSFTIEAYAFDLVVVYRWLDQKGKEIEDLVEADLIDFMAIEKNRGIKPPSINRRLDTCKLLYRFVTGRELVGGAGVVPNARYYRGPGRDRDLGLQMLKGRRYKSLRMKQPICIVDPLDQEQVRHFLGSLKRYRDVAIVLLMLLCGLRSREILTLKLVDVAFDLNRIKVHGKGNKERMLPMSNLVVDVLNRYLNYERPHNSSDELFVVMQGKRRGLSMTRAGLRRIFRTRRLQDDIANANPHRFRHTFGADMARAGVRLPVLQKMMGHAHAETTIRYINLSMADIADEYNKAVKRIEARYQDF